MTDEAKPTALIERDRLLGLLEVASEPEVATLAHTVPREVIRARGSGKLHLDAEVTEVDLTGAQDVEEPTGVSPLLVIAMLVMFVALFFAVVRLG